MPRSYRSALTARKGWNHKTGRVTGSRVRKTAATSLSLGADAIQRIRTTAVSYAWDGFDVDAFDAKVALDVATGGRMTTVLMGTYLVDAGFPADFVSRVLDDSV